MHSTQRKPKTEQQVAAPEVIAPLAYQVAIVNKHVAAYKKGARQRHEGSDMGAGKTFIMCFVAKALKKKLGVIGPKTARKTWKKTAEMIGVDLAFCVGYEQLTTGTKQTIGTFPEKDRLMAEFAVRLLKFETGYAEYCRENPNATPAEKSIYVKSHKPKRPIIEDKTFVFNTDIVTDDILVIVDESHRCKGEDSLTSELLIALKAQDILSASVSATPAISPADMRAMGYYLGMHNLTGFHMWATCRGCISTRFSKLIHVGGDESLHDLHKEIYPKRGCRIKIDDLPKGAFPETQIEAEAYDMGSKEHGQIVAAYDEFHEQLARWEAGMSTIKGMNPLVLMLRLRQKVEMAKVPSFAEMAKDAVESGKRVLVFLSFKESIHKLAEILKTDCLYYGGNKGDREKHLERFQKNEKGAEIMILNIAAGAESISCHDLSGKFPRHSLISPTWSAYKMQQCFGRPHRAGGKSKSTQRIVFAANTIEDKVCQNVQSKMRKMSVLSDGDLMNSHLTAFLARHSQFAGAASEEREA